ncbi:MAG: hypothetical protein IJ863_07455 [Spirochaetales bacterium]|nr:hypothetical protein [Spirochaetales bacterium]
MGKGARRFTGFLWAMIIAIVSFFVIFIFFPDVSNKFFGVSVRPEKVSEVVDSAVSSVSEAVSEKVSQTVSNVVENSK